MRRPEGIRASVASTPAWPPGTPAVSQACLAPHEGRWPARTPSEGVETHAECSTPPETSIGTARRMVSDVPWEGQVFVTTMPYQNRPSRPTRTVSYTHLRAHETRHDLVCRLLLEKKKKKHNQ